MLNCRIVATEYYLPERLVSNEEICSGIGVSTTFVEQRLGIRERHFVGESETCASMGVAAVAKLIESHNIDKDEIDLLIVVTQTPDYVLPGIAPLIQSELGLPQRLAAFDINLACSGFPYALAVAASELSVGLARNAVIVTSECYSKRMNLRDKTVCTLFGDAASATLLKLPEPSRDSGFLAFDFGTDGRGFDKLYVPAGGAKLPHSLQTSREIEYAPGVVRSQNDLYMDGKEVYQFALEIVPVSVNNCLLKAGIDIDQVDFYVFHQANKYMIESLAKSMNLDASKLVINLGNYGNTVSSTIPIALHDLIASASISEGDILLFCGFGVGLSWASCLYKY